MSLTRRQLFATTLACAAPIQGVTHEARQLPWGNDTKEPYAAFEAFEEWWSGKTKDLDWADFSDLGVCERIAIYAIVCEVADGSPADSQVR